MGIFDFFRKKPAPVAPADDGPSFHYVVAHYALRQIALQDPLQYLAIMASPEVREFLQAVLSDVAEQLPGQKGVFTADDLLVHPCRIGDFPCAILEFPVPGEITETYFTALLVMISLGEELPEPNRVEARYLTLEKGASLDGAPRTVLCEWTSTSHLNFGDGPTPTLLAFTDALEKLAAR